METLLRDLRHTLRVLRSNPLFTFATVAALALGIGASTAIFSVANAVLFRPMPFPDGDRVVFLMIVAPNGGNAGVGPARFAKWQQQTAVLQDPTAFRFGRINYTGGDIPEQVGWGQVTANFFRLTGAPIIRGRTFSMEEDLPRGPRTVVISEGFWTERLGRDPDILGRTLSLSGEPYTVIGIVAGSFRMEDFAPAPPGVYTALQLDANSTDQASYLTGAARLKNGVSLEQARARVAIATNEYREQFPNALPPEVTFGIEPMRAFFARVGRSSVFVLFGAVAFVLLIACANVANLLLARATARRREIAIRAAIGAGRWRIVRQLLTESVVLATAGGVLGILLGMAAMRMLLAINTPALPRLGEGGALVTLDGRVLLFTMLLTLGTGLLVGLVPALQSARTDLHSTIKESGGRSGSGFRQNRARSILVVVEVALALILLVGAALFIRTSVALNGIDPGFAPDNVLTMRMSMTGLQFATASGLDQIVQTATERLRRVPGVRFASATCCVPLQTGYSLPFSIPGRPLPSGRPFHGDASYAPSSPEYFEVLGIPLRRGRAFDERDGRLAPPVAVINETMARRFWPDGDPLNQRILIARGLMPQFADEPERQIIGIVGDVRSAQLQLEPGATMYVPHSQMTDSSNALNLSLTPTFWIVRTTVPPSSVSTAVQEALWDVTGLPVSNVENLSDGVRRSTSRQRFNSVLMGIFAGVALVLAAIGIYGLMAYSVEQRTQELGIRLALGADASSVRRMVVVQCLRLVIAGIVVGSAGAFALTRFVEAFLFGVNARDPLVFMGIPVLLAAIALAAAWVPALRASRVDPLEALRYE